MCLSFLLIRGITMFVLTSTDTWFLTVCSFLMLKRVFSQSYQKYSRWHMLKYSKGLYIMLTLFIPAVLFYSYYSFSKSEINDWKLILIYLLFVGIDVYEFYHQQFITERFSWLSIKQENVKLKILGVLLVISILAFFIAIQIVL